MSEAPIFWTPDRLGYLQALWADSSLSASKIGGIIGCSKNAVIGKVRRCKLPLRKEPLPLPQPRPPHPLDLVQPRECCFPIGNPGDEDFHYCRARIETPGRPYCDMHHRRSVIGKIKAEDLI